MRAVYVVPCLLLVSLPLAAIEVTLINPPPNGSPLLGEVEVVAEVRSEYPILRVELYWNGDRVASLTSGPYRFRLDVGGDGAAHHFRVIARDLDGATASAEVTTPELVIHDEMRARLQQIYVTVTGEGGKRVVNLRQERFSLLDEGERQQIVSFAGGDIPFTAVLLIDASRSMRGDPLAEARAATRIFVEGLHGLDEVMVLTFSDRLLSASPVDNDPRVLLDGLDQITSDGGTAVNDMLLLALRAVERRQGRRVVILLSDGNDVHSVLGMKQVRIAARRSQAQIFWVNLGDDPEHGPLISHVDCIRNVRQQERGRRLLATTEILWVCLGDDAEHGPLISYVDSFRSAEQQERERRLLAKVVAESGGRVLPVANLAGIEPAFRDILQELREQYAIGYYPSRDLDDGSWHKVRLRVDGRGLKVRTRTGYLD